jgi:predicted HAD superfamily Cof-like phosphohydrolase
MDSLQQMYNDVTDFMKACNQEVNTSQKSFSEIDENTQKLRISLIKEEFQELLDSETRTDELDALLDLMYVSLGTLATFGYKPVYIQNVNVSTQDYELSRLYVNSRYTYIEFLYKYLISYMGNEITDENISLIEKRNTKELFYILNKFITEVYYLANELFPYFDKAFEEVHRSNMSKLVDGKAIKNESGKVQKGPNYSPPDLEQFS